MPGSMVAAAAVVRSRQNCVSERSSAELPLTEAQDGRRRTTSENRISRFVCWKAGTFAVWNMLTGQEPLSLGYRREEMKGPCSWASACLTKLQTVSHMVKRACVITKLQVLAQDMHD